MPVTGTNPNGNFQGCKIENGTILKLRGLSVLEDDKGTDLLKLLRKGVVASSSELEGVVLNLSKRIDAIEKFLQTLPSSGVKGPKGETGEPGETGAQGAKGKDGAKTLAALTDVDFSGLSDGAVLVWSAKDKKWVVSLED